MSRISHSAVNILQEDAVDMDAVESASVNSARSVSCSKVVKSTSLNGENASKKTKKRGRRNPETIKRKRARSKLKAAEGATCNIAAEIRYCNELEAEPHNADSKLLLHLEECKKSIIVQTISRYETTLTKGFLKKRGALTVNQSMYLKNADGSPVCFFVKGGIPSDLVERAEQTTREFAAVNPCLSCTKEHNRDDTDNDGRYHMGIWRPYKDYPHPTAETIAYGEDFQEWITKNEDLIWIINQWFKYANPDLYNKCIKNLEKIKVRYNLKRLGAFGLCVWNMDRLSKLHRDERDLPDGLCFIVALGDFEGGELYLADYDVIVALQPGDVLAFPSNRIAHGNFPLVSGKRISLVFTNHFHLFYNHMVEIEKEVLADCISLMDDDNLLKELGKFRKNYASMKPKKPL